MSGAACWCATDDALWMRLCLIAALTALLLPLHALTTTGDIVVIKSGDKVPADLRLLQAANLQVRSTVCGCVGCSSGSVCVVASWPATSAAVKLPHMCANTLCITCPPCFHCPFPPSSLAKQNNYYQNRSRRQC